MLYYNKSKTNKKHILRIILLVALIILTTVNPNASRFTSKVYNFVTKPVTYVATFVSKGVTNSIDAIFGTRPNREMVELLAKENNELKAKINNLEFVVNSKDYLKDSLEFQQKNDYISANLIMIENDSKFSNFMIDKGESSGIKVGDEVVSSYGTDENNTLGTLVGRVIEVNANTSMVSSIFDEKYNITFEHSKTNTIGIIINRNNGLLEAYMLDKTEINNGDLVYTSGTGGLYDRGIYIGKIHDVNMSEDGLNQLVKIESPVNFSKLYEVFVISGGSK